MEINPVDVIFLDRADGHKVGEKFPNYFEYQYGANPSKLLDTALANNYLLESSSVKNNLEKAKSSELKELLKKHNLKVSGKKQELIERLLSNASEEKLKTAFSGSYYFLTDKGKSVVNENEHLIYYHKSKHLSQISQISLDEYHDSFKNKKGKSSKYDVALELLASKAYKNRENGDWGLYRNSLHSIAEVCKDKHDKHSALDYYLKVCHIDLSGLSNGNSYIPSTITLAPGIIGYINEMISKLEIKKETLKEYYYHCVEELKLPKVRFSKEESFEYLYRATEEEIDKINEELNEKTKDDGIESLSKEKVDEIIEKTNYKRQPFKKEESDEREKRGVFKKLFGKKKE